MVAADGHHNLASAMVAADGHHNLASAKVAVDGHHNLPLPWLQLMDTTTCLCHDCS